MVTVAEILKNNGLAVEKSEILFFLFQIVSLFTLLFMLLKSDDRILKFDLLNLYAEIMTSTVDIKDDSRGRPVQKAKVMVVICCCHKSSSLWLWILLYDVLFKPHLL